MPRAPKDTQDLRAREKRYRFRGSITKGGVTFTVVAPDEMIAKQYAQQGRYTEYDDGSAETIDWDINPETCEEDTP